jgi:hypothetical protein
MVCAKCEAAEQASTKSTGLAVTDVWKASGSGSDQRNERQVGGNKLLESRKKYRTALPGSGSGAVKPGAGGAGTGPLRRGATAPGEQFGKCKVCRVTVAKKGAVLCQRESIKSAYLFPDSRRLPG